MKRILLSTFVLSMSLFFLVSCNQSGAKNSAVVEKDEIEYYLQTDNYTYTLGSIVKILYRLTNKSNTVRLVGDWPNLGARQPVDIIQGEKDIWRVPAMPYAETEFYLDPNESCEYTMDWEMETWPEFEPVESGIYTVVGELREGSVSVSVNIEITNSAVVEKDGIEYYLQTENHSYNLGDTVEILYRVTNKTNYVRKLGVVPNCEYCKNELYITHGEEEIWRKCRIIPPCGFTEFNLNSNESWEYEDDWDMTNDNGTFEQDDDFSITSSGTYNVVGELRLYEGGTRVPVLVSIEIK